MSKMNESNMKGYYKLYIRLLLSVVIAILITSAMDYTLIKTLYETYYGNSDIGNFFLEQGQNIFSNNVRVTIVKLITYRFLYSVIPIFVTIFLSLYYHVKSFPHKLFSQKLFDKNPSLEKILLISRYILSAGIAFLILNYNRTYYYSVFHNCLIGNREDFLRIIIAGIVWVLLTSDLRLLLSDIISFPLRHKKSTLFAFILFISIVCFALVEFQIGSKLAVLVYLIHINIMYWILLQMIFYELFKNPKTGAIFSLCFAFMIGLANDVVYQFRGNYIMFGDLTVLRTAMEVAGGYKYKPNKWLLISILLLITSIALVVIIKFPKDNNEKSEPKQIYKSVINRVSAIVVIITFILITFKTGDFYGKVFGVGWNYNDNVKVVGYLPYFFSNMDSTTRIKVEGYSVEEADNILSTYKDETVNTTDKNVSPNIIIIQNEAFSDYSITANIKTDKDTMPFIHSLDDNTQKGFLNMSVTGGPTSNTEFEVLTGTSLQFFPYGAVPYTQYLKQHVPSLTEVLKCEMPPYYAVAYHSYYSSGYNRRSAYNFLGFDDSLFEDNFLKDYDVIDLPRGYLSDEKDYEKVINLYEEHKGAAEPFYCFNVTIQSHGGYFDDPDSLPESVSVTNFDATDNLNSYLSLVKMSDTAFEKLINYFSDVEEPTMIFMYGDHQPTLSDDTYEILNNYPAWKNEELQSLSKYYVPYVLWANFDIEEKDDLNFVYEEDYDTLDASSYKQHLNKLSTNYVRSFVLNAAGLEVSDYDRMLLDIHEKYPAITAIGVWDKDGNYYPGAASTGDDLLKKLEIVQYNYIFDQENKLTEHFLP